MHTYILNLNKELIIVVQETCEQPHVLSTPGLDTSVEGAWECDGCNDEYAR